MANVLVYIIAIVFAGVGSLAAFAFFTVTAFTSVSRSAIHEISATLLLLCSIVSFATALLSVQLAHIAQALRDRGEG